MESIQNNIIAVTQIIGLAIVNPEGEKLGKLNSIMLALKLGNVDYAVLTFDAFFKEKLFALPWKLLKFDLKNKQILVNITRERLKAMPGFDKAYWPDMEDPIWQKQIANYYRDF